MTQELKVSMEYWLRSLVTECRQAVVLDDEEARDRIILDDFLAPCQIHFFWFRYEPVGDYALLLLTRLKNLPDETVEVIGPMSPSELDKTMREVLTWDR